jgi:hypothetical protein
MLQGFALAPGETIISTVDGLYLDMGYVPVIQPWDHPSPTSDYYCSRYNLALGTGILTLTNSRLVVTWKKEQDKNERIHHFSFSGIIGYSESPSYDYEYKPSIYSSKKAVSTIIYMATVMFLGGLCLSIACKRGEPEEKQKNEHHARNSETVKLLSSLLAQALFLFRPSNADTGGLAAILAFEEKKRQEQDR